MLNNPEDLRLKLVKELSKIVCNVPSTFDHHQSFSRKEGRKPRDSQLRVYVVSSLEFEMNKSSLMM